MIKNIILVGVGGQGILLAARIIASAAGHAGYDVTTNEIHGMAQRGGSVTAQIRYGEVVHSPLILEGTADVLGALEQVEALRYAAWLKPGALAAVSAESIIPVTVSSGRASYPGMWRRGSGNAFPISNISTAPGSRRKNSAIRGRPTRFCSARWRTGLTCRSRRGGPQSIECVKPQFRELNRRAFEYGRTL